MLDRVHTAAGKTELGFEAVIFDLDGTLVATDRFWLPASQRGCRRAFLELGLERDVPAPREWLRLVGLPLELGLEVLFCDLDRDARRRVQERCEEEEARLVRGGGAALMPGARDCLEALRATGTRLAIASNCSRGYLEQVLGALAIGPLFEAARCLESPCVRHTHPGAGGPKGAMVADLLETLGTRSAAFVGDRAGDREAAHANGLAHVHFSGGFADPEEADGADGVVDDLARIPTLLGERGRVLAEVARELELDRARNVAVSGEHGTDPEALGADLVRAVERAGRGAELVRLVDLGPPGPERGLRVASLLRQHRPGRLAVLVGEDLGGEPLTAAAERRLHLVAAKAARERALLARHRLAGRVPWEEASDGETRIDAPARPAPGGPALCLDLSSPLLPRRVPGA